MNARAFKKKKGCNTSSTHAPLLPGCILLFLSLAWLPHTWNTRSSQIYGFCCHGGLLLLYTSSSSFVSLPQSPTGTPGRYIHQSADHKCLSVPFPKDSFTLPGLMLPLYFVSNFYLSPVMPAAALSLCYVYVLVLTVWCLLKILNQRQFRKKLVQM